MRKKSEFTEKHKKALTWSAIAVFIIMSLFVSYFIGKPAIEFVSEPERFRLWVEEHGITCRIVYMVMVVIQVFVAIIPGEPFEIGAGYAFGAVEGTALTIIAASIGGMIVFLFVRRFGVKAVETFFTKEQITDKLRFFKSSKKRDALFFILFLLPGTPKDFLCYVAGLTDMKLSTWIVICTLARIPSVVTSTIGGSALGTENYIAAVIAFAAAAALAGTGYIMYRKISDRKSK